MYKSKRSLAPDIRRFWSVSSDFNFFNFLTIMAIFLTLILTTIPTGNCDSKVFFLPSNVSDPYLGTSGVEKNQKNINLILTANSTGFQGGQTEIIYDEDCIDVSNLELNGSLFPFGGWDSSIEGREWVTFASVKVLSGTYLMANFTLTCKVNESEKCSNTISFGDRSAIFNKNGQKIQTLFLKGLVECNGDNILFSTISSDFEPLEVESIPGNLEVNKEDTNYVTSPEEFKSSPANKMGDNTDNSSLEVLENLKSGGMDTNSGPSYSDESGKNKSSLKSREFIPNSTTNPKNSKSDVDTISYTDKTPGFGLKTLIFSFLTVLIVRRLRIGL